MRKREGERQSKRASRVGREIASEPRLTPNYRAAPVDDPLDMVMMKILRRPAVARPQRDQGARGHLPGHLKHIETWSAQR